MTTDLLENSQIFFPLQRLERGPSELPFVYSLYSVLFLICSKMATDLLDNFQS